MNKNHFKFIHITSNASLFDIDSHKSIKKRNSSMKNIYKQTVGEKHSFKGNNSIQDYD